MPKAAAAAAPGKKPRKPRVPRKRAAESVGLKPAECLVSVTGGLTPAAARIEEEGGVVLAAYRDPLGGHSLLLAVLPISRVQPTPFQRDLSEAHHKRLAEVINRTGRFLDPVIAVPAPDKGFWTPNGLHRLEAMRRLGARSIAALVLPEREIARQILALNTEKAHNLKERALEVVRIYHGLVEEEPARPESDFAFYLEDASLVTLGIVYEQNRGFAGGAYHPALRRVETFSSEPVRAAFKTHERRAALLADLETEVAEVVRKLKERGLESPYLRSFVVARINPLRFIKGELPAPEKLLETMHDRAARFNVEKVNKQDLAGGFAPVPDEG
jgi:ParB family chromosome partitioning protein